MTTLLGIDLAQAMSLFVSLVLIAFIIFIWILVFRLTRKNKYPTSNIIDIENSLAGGIDDFAKISSNKSSFIVEMDGMDGRGGFGVGSRDMISDSKKKVLLGYRDNGKEIITECTCCLKLEHYLVRTEITSFQKFLARVFRINVCIGTFRPEGKKTGYMKYYLYWHSKCKNFVVAYVHGRRALPCNFCNLV